MPREAVQSLVESCRSHDQDAEEVSLTARHRSYLVIWSSLLLITRNKKRGKNTLENAYNFQKYRFYIEVLILP